MTEPDNVTEQDVVDLVVQRKTAIESKTKRPFVLFTFSVSENADDNVHRLPKTLACSVKPYGIWSRIVDPEDKVESLTSYFQLLALGLGE